MTHFSIVTFVAHDEIVMLICIFSERRMWQKGNNYFLFVCTDKRDKERKQSLSFKDIFQGTYLYIFKSIENTKRLFCRKKNLSRSPGIGFNCNNFFYVPIVSHSCIIMDKKKKKTAILWNSWFADNFTFDTNRQYQRSVTQL